MINATRLSTVLGVMALLALDGACSRNSTPAPVLPRIGLEVYNGSFFDVNVLALPTISGTRVRLGTARSYATTVLAIPNQAYRAGGSLVLELHAIGSNRSWTTPELPMAWDLTPCLDILGTASGDLSHSSFYSVVSPDSLSKPGRGRTACGFLSAAVDAAR